MKTTLELPDEVMISLKVKAAQEGKKMKALVEEALRQFLYAEKANPESTSSQNEMPVFSVGEVYEEDLGQVREGEIYEARGSRY